MASQLEALIRQRLTNVVTTSGGFIAQCPACATTGADLRGKNHLKIYNSGAFGCVVDDSKAHNKFIYSFLYDKLTEEQKLDLETNWVDPDPKIAVDVIYPESMLAGLLPDHSYWIKRGVDEAILRKLEGGVAPKEKPSKLSGRYVFPIRDHISGRIVGFSGRILEDGNTWAPKYKHMVKSGRVIYPLWVNKEAILKQRKVVLVESVGDALSLMTKGIDCVLILLGLNLNSKFFGFLVSAGLQKIIVSLNDDPPKIVNGIIAKPGNRGAKKIMDKLTPFFGEHRVMNRPPTTGKDWNEVLMLGGDEINEFKKELELL